MESVKIDKLKSKIKKYLVTINSTMTSLTLVRNEFYPQELGLFVNGLYFFDTGEEKNIPIYMQSFLMEQNIKFIELQSIMKFINKDLQCAVLVLDYGQEIIRQCGIENFIYGKKSESCQITKKLTINL